MRVPSGYTARVGGNTRTPKRECHWLEVNRGPPGTPDWSPYRVPQGLGTLDVTTICWSTPNLVE